MRLRHCVRCLGLAAVLSLAACTNEAPVADEEPGDEIAPPAAPAPAAPAPPPVPVTPADPATDLSFAGAGSVAFGSAPAALASAWPGGVAGEGAAPGSTCHFLYAQPKPADSFGVAFMVEGDRFVRVDVDAPDRSAPGGGRVGMHADQLRELYAGRLEEQPHKYIEGGQVFIVTPPDGGEARLLFDLDAAGLVTSWRIGLPPQVHYVEGCS
jgi:hypothetical protein